jgi:uncharacterized protein
MQFGSFEKVDSVWAEKKGQKETIFMECKFKVMKFDLLLSFNKEHKLAGAWFRPPSQRIAYEPPAYARPENIIEKKIEIRSGNLTLPGILTLPANVKNAPLVILVHGSGPNDMDESLGPLKVFKDLSYGLANKGIATLRYDKRTLMFPETFMDNKYTVREEVTEDAINAVKLAKTLPGIDPGKLVILGHSLGGVLAPQIVSEAKDVKGAVLFAALARPLHEVVVEQYSYIFSLDGKISPEEKTVLDSINIAKSRVDNLVAGSNIPPSLLPLELPAAYWLDLKQHDPAATASRLKKKLLIMQGERDYQVTMEDFRIFKERLGNKPTVTFKSYPKLNHAFVEGEGKCTPEEYDRKGNVAEYVIEDIAEWVSRL